MAKPLVVQLMEHFRDELLKKEQKETAAMLREWQKIEHLLLADVEEFVARLAVDGLTPGQLRSRQFQMDRYASLLAQTRGQLDKFTAAVAPAIQKRKKAAAQEGIDLATASIKAVAGRITFDVLPVGAVENIVALAGNGSPLGDLLRRGYGAGARGMLDQLIAGTARGLNPKVIARAMVRDGLSQTLGRVINVARTEPMRAFREASRQQYVASKVVEQYMRLATKSDRTCAACLIADGEVYEVGEPMRAHPMCRCTQIPIVTGFKPVVYEKGRDWLTKQPPGVQRKILGPARFNAWKDGADLDEMVSVRTDPVWGDSLQPTPAKNLGNGGPRFQMRTLPDAPPGINKRTAAETRAEMAKLDTDVAQEIGALSRRRDAIQDELASVQAKQDIVLQEYYAVEKNGTAAELAAVDARYTELEQQAQAVMDRKAELTAQILRTQNTRAERLRALVYVDDPADIQMSINIKTKKLAQAARDAWQPGLDAFNKLVSKDVWSGTDFLAEVDTKGRAFARTSLALNIKEVHLGKRETTRVIVHEISHILEVFGQDVLKKTLAFYDRRTAGESLELLRDVMNDKRYRTNEATRKDKFIHPYIGKEYGRRNTEVLSMGVEEMFADPLGLANADTDFFDFIYNLLRGR